MGARSPRGKVSMVLFLCHSGSFTKVLACVSQRKFAASQESYREGSLTHAHNGFDLMFITNKVPLPCKCPSLQKCDTVGCDLEKTVGDGMAGGCKVMRDGFQERCTLTTILEQNQSVARWDSSRDFASELAAGDLV